MRKMEKISGERLKRRQASAALAAEVALWMKRLVPRLPQVPKEDMQLILWNIFRRKYGGELKIFLHPNKGGGHAF